MRVHVLVLDAGTSDAAFARNYFALRPKACRSSHDSTRAGQLSKDESLSRNREILR